MLSKSTYGWSSTARLPGVPFLWLGHIHKLLRGTYGWESHNGEIAFRSFFTDNTFTYSCGPHAAGRHIGERLRFIEFVGEGAYTYWWEARIAGKISVERTATHIYMRRC